MIKKENALTKDLWNSWLFTACVTFFMAFLVFRQIQDPTIHGHRYIALKSIGKVGEILYLILLICSTIFATYRTYVNITKPKDKDV